MRGMDISAIYSILVLYLFIKFLKAKKILLPNTVGMCIGATKATFLQYKIDYRVEAPADFPAP